MEDRVVLVIQDVLNWEEITELRRECECYLASMKLGDEELCQRSCALDFFEESSIPDNSRIRHDRIAYLSERWRGQQYSAQECSRRIIEEFIFCKLPGLLQVAVGPNSYFLFNEHYIVKPPHSGLEFGWHIDEEKQLGCLSTTDYVTVWCALDDVSNANGTLVVEESTKQIHARLINCEAATRPGKRRRNTIEEDESSEGVALCVTAGTVAVFSSKLRHRSGCNTSDKLRRVFYAQFSTAPITASDGEPLNFAVKTTPSDNYNITFL